MVEENQHEPDEESEDRIIEGDEKDKEDED
jgi:hypothetical protein